MNLQVIASPGGDILWVWGALPGLMHGKKAEWILGVLATGGRGPGRAGRQGLPGRRAREDPVPGRNKLESQKQANKAHAELRSPGERANAPLSNCRILPPLAVASHGGNESSPTASALPSDFKERRLPERPRLHPPDANNGAHPGFSGTARAARYQAHRAHLYLRRPPRSPSARSAEPADGP